MEILAKTSVLRSMARWLVVGAFFTALTVPILYVAREIAGLPLAVASLCTWELCTVLRFIVTDGWVFQQERPTLQRFWKYHVAALSSFVIWWVGTNAMPHVGVHYLVASVLSTGCSLSWSLITNYLWVWRQPRKVAR